MGFLHIKEQRTRHRILARRNRFSRRRNAAHCRHFQLVLIVFIKGQAKDADAVGVGINASESFGIIAIDINRTAILTHIEARIFGIIFRHTRGHHGFHSTGNLATLEQHFVLKNFACSVLCAGNKGHDISRWKLTIEVSPLLMRIFDNRTAYKNLGAKCIENISRLESSVSWSVNLAGKDNTVIPDAHFDDVSYPSFGAGFDFFFANCA